MPPNLAKGLRLVFQGDWRWKSALGVLAVFAAFVVAWPLPESDPPPLPVPAEPENPPPPSEPDYAGMVQYRVQADDTLESIARLFVVSPDDLRRVNDVPDGRDIVHGQRIWIPAQSQ